MHIKKHPRTAHRSCWWLPLHGCFSTHQLEHNKRGHVQDLCYFVFDWCLYYCQGVHAGICVPAVVVCCRDDAQSYLWDANMGYVLSALYFCSCPACTARSCALPFTTATATGIFPYTSFSLLLLVLRLLLLWFGPISEFGHGGKTKNISENCGSKTSNRC